MTKQQAIKHFGNVATLASQLKISTQAVYDWPEKVPQLRQFQLEKMTDGALKAEAAPQTQAA